MRSSSLWDNRLIGSVMAKAHVGKHSCCEFTSTAACHFQKTGFHNFSSLPSGSDILSVSTSMMFPVLGGTIQMVHLELNIKQSIILITFAS